MAPSKIKEPRVREWEEEGRACILMILITYPFSFPTKFSDHAAVLESATSNKLFTHTNTH